MTDYIVPSLLLAVSVVSLHKKENTYDRLLTGASQGLKILLSIVPALIVLLTAVSIDRKSVV